MTRENRDKPLDLKTLSVRTPRGELVQLDNLVTLREQSSPPALYRFDRYVSATVSAGLARGYTLGDGITAMRGIADRVLDETFSTALDGPSKDYADSSSSLVFAFVLALVIHLPRACRSIRSFRDPFIIMFTVPLALAGALFSLWYFNQTINIFSQIGQIMLIGLVTKNGILIVEFANQRKSQGMSLMEAIQDASATRLRPILMTALSTVSRNTSHCPRHRSRIRKPGFDGYRGGGGLILATGLTLYVIPAIYSYVSKEGKVVSNVEMALGAAHEEEPDAVPVANSAVK